MNHAAPEGAGSYPTDRRPLVTLVVPAYNEEQNLPETFARITKVVDGLRDYDFELLLVDNASHDATERMCRQRVASDPRWRYLRFSRNFGFETSIMAGLHYAQGDALIVVCSDLQDPPESIPTMLAKWREGYDVVYGELQQRNDANLLKTLGAKAAYGLIHALSDVKIPPNAADFRLISRPVMEAVKRCGERSRYMRGLVHWVGFRQTSFPHNRAPRKRGISTAGLAFCFHFALTGLVAFSTRPLRWSAWFGATSMALAGFGLVVCALSALAGGTAGLGWWVIGLLIVLMGGAQGVAIGILGEYLAQVHVEVKQRPRWVIHRTAGFPPAQDPLANLSEVSVRDIVVPPPAAAAAPPSIAGEAREEVVGAGV